MIEAYNPTIVLSVLKYTKVDISYGSVLCVVGLPPSLATPGQERLSYYERRAKMFRTAPHLIIGPLVIERHINKI